MIGRTIRRAVGELAAQEGQHALQRLLGGVAFSIDEIVGERRVRVAVNPVRVRRRRVDLDGLKGLAQRLTVVGEALGRTERIFGEAQAEHLALARLQAIADAAHLVGRQVQGAAPRWPR